MPEPTQVLQPIRGRWSRRTRGVAISLFVLVAMTGGGGYYWWRTIYPYGMTHACDKNLWWALRQYAETHDGNFPRGEATPEASMSLVGSDHAHNLVGKRLSPAKTKAILDSGRLLDPATCGWNYVEGLREDDDYRRALFWDKDGLDHFGARLEGGGHIVMSVRGDTKHVQAAEWPEFLREQEELWDKLRASGRTIRMSETGRTPAGGMP